MKTWILNEGKRGKWDKNLVQLDLSNVIMRSGGRGGAGTVLVLREGEDGKPEVQGPIYVYLSNHQTSIPELLSKTTNG